MRRRRSQGIAALYLLLAVAPGCSSATSTGKMTLTFIDYHRGASSPGRSDLAIATGAGETRFHDVHLEGESLFPDDSVVPNAFIKPLLRLDFQGALNAFTEPYYGYRFHHFFKSRPRWGFGVEFTHLKAFIADYQQKVTVTGPWPVARPDGQVVLGDHFATLNVSHGVNHVAFTAVRRWMLRSTDRIPDGRLQPFVTLGGGPAVPHLELTVIENGQTERKAFSYNLGPGNWGMGAGAGVRWKISPHFGTFGEYRWTYSILNNMQFDNGEEARVSMRFASHHLNWGISFGL